MSKNESENAEQVIKAITALKEIADGEGEKSDAKEGVDLEAIVKKISRKRTEQLSSK